MKAKAYIGQSNTVSREHPVEYMSEKSESKVESNVQYACCKLDTNPNPLCLKMRSRISFSFSGELDQERR